MAATFDAGPTGASADTAPTGAPAGARRRGAPGRLTAGGLLVGVATCAVILVALAVRHGVVFGVVVLAVIFIPLEKLFALHPRRVLRPGWRTDVVHLLVNNLLSTVGLIVPVVTVGLGLRALVPAGLHRAVGAQPVGAQLAEAVLLASLGGYAGHRAAHQIPWLWRFHKVHHSIRDMDWLAAGHLHPVDTVWTRSCTVIPVFALGFSRASFGALTVLLTFWAIFIHANVRWTFGPLRWLIATPEFHHWHHANEAAAHNTNYAAEFPWVDALFGTLYLPVGVRPSRYGIDEDEPSGYLRQLAWPFRPVTAPGR